MSRPQTMSRPNMAWLAGALLLLLTGEAASARLALIESKLNLRQGPGPEHRVIAVMPAGANITVGECRGEWCQVEFRGQRGYASSLHLNNGAAAFAAAPAQAAPAATKYDPDDAVRILNWHDREWRDRYWREMESQRGRR